MDAVRTEFSFERLGVWQDARALTKRIYEATGAFPREEQFGLQSQIRRAAVSVASNIAEGTSRRSDNDKIRFTEIAYGSLMEVCCQLEIARDLNFLNAAAHREIRARIAVVAKKLGALRRSFLTRSRNP